MTQAGGKLSFEVAYDNRVSFALQQNDVPVVRALRLTNPQEAPLADVRVRITAEPEFAAPWEARIDRIAGHGGYALDAVDLTLSPSYLVNLSERTGGLLWVEAFQGEALLHRQPFKVELLAYDEWGGLRSLPEILAAFVLPNHPSIERVLAKASELLKSRTGDGSLSGYQSKEPARVREVVRAVYGALQSLGISYINPPASFEHEGQKIRLPDRVLEARLATCLDLTVLAAACLEQAGLHPLLVLVQGHAFPGVWLVDECFTEPAVEDLLRLRKRVDLGEILVFEATWLASARALDFEAAADEGKRRLKPDGFLSIIDVLRARKGRIRPLPPRAEEGTFVPVPGAADPTRPASPGPATRGGSTPAGLSGPDAEAANAETPLSRLDRWRRRLLDLSLRNRLLNFRETKKTLPLLCPDLGALEDALADGATFRIRPRPADMGAGDPRDPEAYRRRTGGTALDELLREEMKARRLYANLAEEELNRRLTEIYRAARLALEEGGASALYLAVGFLVWYEDGRSQVPRQAPLILLPLEVHRRSIQQGVEIRLGDDEPRFNVTLLQMLAQDFELSVPGVDPLPEDESGIDVPGVLRAVRMAVRDVDRWDVVEKLEIGFFSFQKYLMWRDLQERADLLVQNRVVDHLVNRPNEPFRGDGDGHLPDPGRLDRDRSPLETFTPLDADSSQLTAVFAAADARSFVLEGPPGTGKSQTITNIIAQCLAAQKSVLFVSEKMAALSVVRSRLQKVGLGRFCLELHSHKTHKQEVIQQLGHALEATGARLAEEWRRTAERLEETRAGLNVYAEALHRPWKSGETLFQVTSRLIGLRDVPRVALRWVSPEDVDRGQLEHLRDLAERLRTAATACGDVRSHPWASVGHPDWSNSWAARVEEGLGALEEAIAGLEGPAHEAGAALGLPGADGSLTDLQVLAEAAGLFLDSPAPPSALLLQPDWAEIRDRITAWIARGRRRDALRGELFARYAPEVLKLDLDALAARLRKAQRSWAPVRAFTAWRVRQALSRASVHGHKPTPEQVAGDLESARALRAEEAGLAAESDEARHLLGRYWAEGEPVWENVERLQGWVASFRALSHRAANGDLQKAAALRSRWTELATEGRELLAPAGALGLKLSGFRQALDSAAGARQKLAELLVLHEARAWGGPAEPGVLPRIRAALGRWRDAAAGLRQWCAWVRVRQEGLRTGLRPLVDGYEAGEFPGQEIPRVFERSYSQWFVEAVTDREPEFRDFFSPEHERRIHQFRELDGRHLELSREVIAARLAAEVPDDHGSVNRNSELGILKRELGKKRRHKSVRRLFAEIPNLLPRLKPCLLMSPLSVAQYLDAKHPPFDVVVFDEASQIPVWDAVGAIARGEQAVIVGDPKQLPPTNFFNRAEGSDGEGDEDYEELESILDECMAAQVPLLTLDWHYRSRHESLIAFSNCQYYEGRLLTFPAAETDSLGVRWRHVPAGVYDRGRSATNRGEADAVVAEIVVRLSDPTRCASSIGVVTFSQAQQTLVEDLLDAARRERPEIEPFFGEDAPEPVFVKNLENVQGDERDVILFSICYGPDAQGRVAMNFGPLNREGGERRLNVAITRARQEVLVFSTLRPEQIDLARTRARGVQDLKVFLEYAARGAQALAEAARAAPELSFDSPFERKVFDALTERGWTVHTQVGCSGYRVDLGVVDPEAPGRYILGVECDGANYHRAKTARDRDRLREAVLRDLGWEIHRIWSSDWWTDPARETEKLETALARAKQKAAALRATPQPAGGRPEVAAGDEPKPPESSNEAPLPKAEPAVPEAVFAKAPPPPQTKIYHAFDTSSPRGTQDVFYLPDPAVSQAIRDAVCEVVQHEFPITLPLVARRVGELWGFSKVTQKLLDRVQRKVPSGKLAVEEVGGKRVLWPKDQSPDGYRGFRAPGLAPATQRSVDDLPPVEIANAAEQVLRQHVAMPAEDLYRETARLFGIQRLGKAVRTHMAVGVTELEKAGRCRVDGETVTLK